MCADGQSALRTRSGSNWLPDGCASFCKAILAMRAGIETAMVRSGFGVLIFNLLGHLGFEIYPKNWHRLPIQDRYWFI
jgi:hypothetical protein